MWETSYNSHTILLLMEKAYNSCIVSEAAYCFCSSAVLLQTEWAYSLYFVG